MLRYSSCFLPFLLCLFVSSLVAQGPLSFGGGEAIVHQQTECLTETQRSTIWQQLAINKADLRAKGLLPATNGKLVVSFDFPLRKAAGFDFNGFYAVSNYVDHNTTFTGAQYGASNLDYNCGNHTYDTGGGYNHAGTDYYTWPFPWYQYENDLAEIIAAEAGTIIGKFDGNKDDNCSCQGDWNAVYVQHSDGSVAWYGHLKLGSLTNKAIGQTVAKGEFLGILASSGCSTGPHLHFEVYDNNNNLIDPYAGNCNSLNNTSWWVNQPTYREPNLNALLTHDAPPVLGCPSNQEEPNIASVFEPGDLLYTALYFRDETPGDVTQIRILRPNNSLWGATTHNSNTYYNSSYWYWSWTLPTTNAEGMWTLEATYNGEVISRNFQVGAILPVTFISLSANRIEKDILLDWTTIDEEDNAGFTIERSAKQINWEAIGEVAGRNHDGENEYHFIDTNAPKWETNFYRLKQVDFDGTFTYSSIVKVDPVVVEGLTLFPNPANEEVKIIGGTGDYEVFDACGRKVLSTTSNSLIDI
ncbi:MAG: M23 family metallopeptidase, partial [Bacteroidota bacterium]